MADYIKLNSGSKAGELSISRTVFEQVASEAVDRVNGASVAKKHRITLSRPVQAIFQKDGKVKISVSVNLKKGSDVKNICLEIQEQITVMLMAYLESVPFDVQINVVEIK